VTKPQRIVVVTGMSGGGKATAVRALEDAGYFCIDNLPVPVIPKLLDLLSTSQDVNKIALVIDARETKFLGESRAMITEARALGHHIEVLFLDSSDEALVRRFSETRRRHPLAPNATVLEGIAAERAMLADLHDLANEIIDTTQTTVHELKQIVQERFAAADPATALAVTIMSFGYRNGIPMQADIVLDVRFLPNPYFVPEFRALPGTNPAVSKWVLGHSVAEEFLTRARDLLTFLLPRYRDEGKAYLTVALGCTGGRHRSVALTEALGSMLTAQGIRVRTRHRDVDRE